MGDAETERVIDRVVFQPKVWKTPGPVEVIAHLSDGTTTALFSYYPDEIGFSAAELTGLTVEAARSLHHRRDRERLQSP
jgi:hypothetical protein